MPLDYFKLRIGITPTGFSAGEYFEADYRMGDGELFEFNERTMTLNYDYYTEGYIYDENISRESCHVAGIMKFWEKNTVI